MTERQADCTRAGMGVAGLVARGLMIIVAHGATGAYLTHETTQHDARQVLAQTRCLPQQAA